MAHESRGYPGPERRSELRIPCNHTPVELTIVDSTIKTMAAVIVNASKTGLRIVSDTRTGLGQQVRVKMEKLIIFGEVRHCHAAGPVFETGVKITDVVGARGLCGRLTEEQIEMLALGRGLTVRERIYARYHTRHCRYCSEQLQATKTLFAKVHAA